MHELKETLLIMGKMVKYWILAFAIAGFTFMAYSQVGQQGPPEPKMQSQSNAPVNGKGPCDRPDNPGQGSPPPPPPGLCLPINDYLLPLLISGVALGALSIVFIEKKQGAKISAL